MTSSKYIGMDVHKESISIAVRNAAGKIVEIRGLNKNCNHHLKNVFKGAAATALTKPGPLRELYTALVAKGMRPEMARLTLARKIATIVLIVWKRGVCFDASHLKPQTA